VSRGRYQVPAPARRARSGDGWHGKVDDRGRYAPFSDAPPRGSRQHKTGTVGAPAVGRSSDLRTWVWRPGLLPIASQATQAQCQDRFRFRLPLRGSPGSSPDSLLSPTDSRVWQGTNETHDIGGGLDRQHKMWCKWTQLTLDGRGRKCRCGLVLEALRWAGSTPLRSYADALRALFSLGPRLRGDDASPSYAPVRGGELCLFFRRGGTSPHEGNASSPRRRGPSEGMAR
jgi:hypothetical protein